MAKSLFDQPNYISPKNRSLELTLRCLKEDPKLALTIYYKPTGRFSLEIRKVEDGELVATPIEISEKERLETRFDLLDIIGERILRRIKLITTGRK